LRRLTSEVRRTVLSSAFVEGWAHYAEELCVEEGFGLRERARKEWGTGFTLQRFHKALMDLGSPPARPPRHCC
jgi:uncharacterized protein (DUF885 family)